MIGIILILAFAVGLGLRLAVWVQALPDEPVKPIRPAAKRAALGPFPRVTRLFGPAL